MMLPSDTIVEFHLFYDGAVDIQIWALLTRSQCKVSDTQVTVKACGPLVFKQITISSISFLFRSFITWIYLNLGQCWQDDKGMSSKHTETKQNDALGIILLCRKSNLYNRVHKWGGCKGSGYSNWKVLTYEGWPSGSKKSYGNHSNAYYLAECSFLCQQQSWDPHKTQILEGNMWEE